MSASAVPTTTQHSPSQPMPEETHSIVQEYYGKTLASSADLKTSACKTPTCQRPDAVMTKVFSLIPDQVASKYYGCGTPIPRGIQGLRVLDLGSGSGRDCYALAYLVGPQGSVLGIDMTDEQLDVARRNVDVFSRNIGWQPNLEFRKGIIEDLHAAHVPDDSIDLCVSNCVVNLSPDKRAVLREVYRVLSLGGEFYFSDVYSDRRQEKSATQDQVLLGECLGGAIYVNDFLNLCREVGFHDPRVVSVTETEVLDPELKALAGETRYFSITYRLFKAVGLESGHENYGQVATYKGGIPDTDDGYRLDYRTMFPSGQPVPVSGNTAAILTKSWLSKYFEVSEQGSHQGAFYPTELSPLFKRAAKSGGCC